MFLLASLWRCGPAEKDTLLGQRVCSSPVYRDPPVDAVRRCHDGRVLVGEHTATTRLSRQLYSAFESCIPKAQSLSDRWTQCFPCGDHIRLWHFDPVSALWPRLLADLAVGVGAIVATTVVMFVAIKITEVINHAMLKRSPSSREFYVKAKKNLWQQAPALCIVGWAVIGVIAVRHLTQVGRSTPVIMWTVQVLGGVTSAVFTVFTGFNGPPPESPSVSRSPDQTAPRKPQDTPQRLRESGGSTALLDIPHVKRMPTWKFYSSHALERGHNSNVGSHPHRHY
ncbi:unnamed protein product [Ectocarpus sp. 12 AP-2014]